MTSRLPRLGIARTLLALAALVVVAVPRAGADDQCKPASPLPQSKCTKDSQCCRGLVCQGGRCQGGVCHIGGGTQTAGQRNTAPNNCQSCQPTVSTSAWTNLSATAICRSSTGVCDPAETCSGTSATCPSDAKSSAVCRSAAGVCDQAESCDGTHSNCPTDGKKTGVCRSAAGDCDVAESCDGSGDECPADSFQPPSLLCRPAQGDCDVAESCDGTSKDCPADGYASSTVVCRPSIGDCDAADSCTGTGTDCPADAAQSDGTPCDDGGMCASGVCETTTTTTTSSTTTTTGVADLGLTNSASPTQIFGCMTSSVTFTVKVHNFGPDTATGVEVTDQVTSPLSCQGSTPTQGTYDCGTGVWMVGTLADGGEATLPLMTEANCCAASGSHQNNTATITASDQPDSNSTNDEAMASVFFACD